MKVARVRALDAHDRKRFVELTSDAVAAFDEANVDAVREEEYLAAVFNMGFVRQSWRAAHEDRRKRK